MSIKVSIIIPNWNGRAFLSRCVAAILQSAVEYGESFECLLMDDASTDGSSVETYEQFPRIQVYQHDNNLGFGQMVNAGARHAQGEILVLVNNDLIARPDFITKLCEPFNHATDVFGVSGKTIDWDNGSPNHVNMRGYFDNGSLKLTWSDDADQTETMFLQGGSCAVRRDLFLNFGGFHPLFSPGYWEDYDISYQALKAGFKNIYEPAAIGSHLGQGSMIRAHGRDRIEFVRERNRHLWAALNLTDAYYHDEFWKTMPDYVRRGDSARFKHRLKTFTYLLTNSGTIRRERIARAERQKTTDAEIFQKFKGLGALC